MEEKKKFIVPYSLLLKNRSEKQHVCNLCLKDIKCDKVPKRSKKCHFMFASFPSYLEEMLQRVCRAKPNNAEASDVDVMKMKN